MLLLFIHLNIALAEWHLKNNDQNAAAEMCKHVLKLVKDWESFQLETMRKKQLHVEENLRLNGGYDNTIQWWSDFFNVTVKGELIVENINQQLKQQLPKYSLENPWIFFFNFHFLT